MHKKIYSTALVTVLCATLALGVNQPAQQTPEWVKVNSTEGRFSASMPATPERDVQDVDTAVGKLQLYSFSSAGNAGQFMLSYADYTREPTTAEQEKVLDGVRGGVLKGLNAELVTETKITLQGHPGREFRAVRVTDGSEVVFNWKMFLVGKRLYQMGVGTMKSDAESPDIQRFFKSFQLAN